MDIAQNSLLAKLLAKENITVFSGNFATAYFDCENRHLGLPNWGGIEKETSDLFISHEVGHALWTPADGIERFRKEMPHIPFSVLNIVEDIRIEKKIKNQYPGLIHSFRKGYSNLLKENFFGINGKSIETMRFIDRINIKAKGGELILVPFNQNEQSMFDESMTVETFDDVLVMVKKIYEFTLDEVKEEEDAPNENGSSDAQSPDENTKISQNNSEAKEEKTEDSDKGSEDSEEKEEEAKEDVKSKKKEKTSPKNTSDAQRELSSETDKSLDQAMRSKAIHTAHTYFFLEPNKKKVLDGVIGYKSFYEYIDYKASHLGGYGAFERKTFQDRVDSNYPDFIRDIRKNVGILCTEFNRKKAAFEYSRATESKTGKINLNKLHSYQYNEDIFLSTTQLAQAKDHGLILLIDYSQSMERQISAVITQAIAIAEFCKTVSIPFDIYTFTDGSIKSGLLDNAFCNLDLKYINFANILSSEMNKGDYHKGIKYLHFLAFLFREENRNNHPYCNYARMGSTPLNEALVTLNYIKTVFQSKHKVQKMNVLVITDGVGSSTDIIDHNPLHDKLHVTRDNTYSPLGEQKLIGVINNKKITIGFGSRGDDNSAQHVALTNHLREPNTTLIGFFIPSSNSTAYGEISKALHYTNEKNVFNDLKLQYKTQGFVKMDNTKGFDSYFVTSIGSDLKDCDDEFEVKENASTTQITAAFKNFAHSKKENRIFLTEFIRAIA